MTTISNCLPGTSLICFLRGFFFFSFLEIFLVLSFESLVLSCCLTSCLYELDKTAVSQSWGSSLLQTRPPCGLAACDGWFGQPGGRRGVPKVSGALACGEAGCVYKCHGDSSCSFRSRLKWAWATRPGTQRDSLAEGGGAGAAGYSPAHPVEGPGRRAPPSRHLRPPSSLACRTPASFLLAVRSASTCPLRGPIAPGARGRRGERGGRERLRQGGPGLRRRLTVLASSLFRGRRIGAGSCAGAVLTLQVGRGPARAPCTCHSPGHGRPARRLLRAGAPAAPGLSTRLLCLLGVQKLLLQPSVTSREWPPSASAHS